MASSASRRGSWTEARPVHWWFDPFFISMVEPVLPRLARLPVERPRLLHLGCGSGVKTETFRRLGYDAIGIDLNDALLGEAARCFPATRFEKGDMHQIPFEDASFDVVFSFSTLQLTHDKQRVIDESARVLRPGGQAVFIENLKDSPLARGYRFMYQRVGRRYRPLETPKAHFDFSEDLRSFEKCFSDLQTTVYHVTTPLTLILPTLSAQLRGTPMRIHSERAYEMLAQADRWLFEHFPSTERLAWHLVATMTRRRDGASR